MKTVRHNAGQSRYELETEHGLAVAIYREQGNRAVFTHTEVPPADEAKGIATRLVRAALDDVRRRGFKIVPACSFVARSCGATQSTTTSAAPDGIRPRRLPPHLRRYLGMRKSHAKASASTAPMDEMTRMVMTRPLTTPLRASTGVSSRCIKSSVRRIHKRLGTKRPA
jgi:uncharacterized protein